MENGMNGQGDKGALTRCTPEVFRKMSNDWFKRGQAPEAVGSGVVLKRPRIAEPEVISWRFHVRFAGWPGRVVVLYQASRTLARAQAVVTARMREWGGCFDVEPVGHVERTGGGRLVHVYPEEHRGRVIADEAPARETRK